MIRITGILSVASLAAVLSSGCTAPERRITLAEYEDKVYASWLGQVIGNIYGLPHEWQYWDEPRTEPIEGYEEQSLAKMREVGGAFSDDDTDIEYTMLFCMERHGPEPTYAQVAEFWKRHINDYIWVANRSARQLMDKGYLPPLTGRRGVNPNWYQIDPQLVCEIWAVTAPGMLDYASAKADWAARVTNDDYGTHPTIWYNTMYAAAFFETDVERLCQIGYEHVPKGSIFREAIDDVRRWKARHGDDWVAVRQLIKKKYHDREGMPDHIDTGLEGPAPISAVLNGALGVLALLYGEGDFEKTMNYACMAGYDADNQSATLAGLIGIMHGSEAIPRKYTHVFAEWELPLNDMYRNVTRDDLPDGRLTDIARRTARLGERLVTAHGGRVESDGGEPVLVINPRARFQPPLEVRLFPVHVHPGVETTVKVERVGGDPSRPAATHAEGVPPSGMRYERRDGELLIRGVPRLPGQSDITLAISDGLTRDQITLPLHVLPDNLAQAADEILAAVTRPAGRGSPDLNVLRDGAATPHYESFNPEINLEEDFYGYHWHHPVRVARLVFQPGPVTGEGGWFETLDIQYRTDQGHWRRVAGWDAVPGYTPDRAKEPGVRFTLSFEPLTTTAIRIIGKPGGPAAYTSIAELEVHAR